MNQPPTKQAIAKRLKRLSSIMKNIAVDMDYYGGFAQWSRHGAELLGAADISKEWSQEIWNEIRKEIELHGN